MADKTNFAQQATLEFNLKISPAGTVYLGLLTAAGTDASAGTEVNSGVETNYARKPVTWNATHLVSGLFQTENAAQISFGAAVVGYIVVQEALYDALTGGNRIYYKTVTNQSVAVGNSYVRPAGSIVVRES